MLLARAPSVDCGVGDRSANDRVFHGGEKLSEVIILGYLEQSGCFSATAMSADLAGMCDRHTDLVVADYDMAGEDWLSRLQTTAAREAEVGRRLLLLVSGPVPEDTQRGLEGAGASFLLKPFTREQFLDAGARVIH